MLDYRHAGCKTPVVRFLPDGAPFAGMPLRSSEWRLIVGGLETPMGPLVTCPDCGNAVTPSSRSVEVVPAEA